MINYSSFLLLLNKMYQIIYRLYLFLNLNLFIKLMYYYLYERISKF